MRSDYHTSIKESSRELTSKEKLTLKDFNDAQPLDSVVGTDGFIIDPDVVAVIAVHNERARDDKDYETIIILDKSGTKYSSSSKSLRDSLSDIMDDLAEFAEEDREDMRIKIFKKESKNYTGKYFLTATVV